MYDYLERGLKADALAEGVDKDDGYISDLRKGFRGAARLLKSKKGPRNAVLSVDGWDTHADQGTTNGPLANLLGELDLGIADFKKESGNSWDNTVMVLVTEFGRTARVNGDAGTDHGVGTDALLAGGAVKGKNVYGDWPGLAPAKLYQGSDLAPTTDLRSVFKGILSDHLGVPSSILNNTVFPDSNSAPIMQGLVAGASANSTPEMGDMPGSPRMAMRPDSAIARYRRGERVSVDPRAQMELQE
jgi:uncharacterized protein (DUF1501 family)